MSSGPKLEKVGNGIGHAFDQSRRYPARSQYRLELQRDERSRHVLGSLLLHGYSNVLFFAMQKLVNTPCIANWRFLSELSL